MCMRWAKGTCPKKYSRSGRMPATRPALDRIPKPQAHAHTARARGRRAARPEGGDRRPQTHARGSQLQEILRYLARVLQRANSWPPLLLPRRALRRGKGGQLQITWISPVVDSTTLRACLDLDSVVRHRYRISKATTHPPPERPTHPKQQPTHKGAGRVSLTFTLPRRPSGASFLPAPASHLSTRLRSSPSGSG
jgi:hypothetical protein